MPTARKRERSFSLPLSLALHVGAILLLLFAWIDEPHPAAVPPAAIVATLVTRAAPSAAAAPASEVATPIRKAVTPAKPKPELVRRAEAKPAPIAEPTPQPPPASVEPSRSAPSPAQPTQTSAVTQDAPMSAAANGVAPVSAAPTGPVMVQFPYAYLARMSRTIVMRLNYPAYSRQFGQEGRAIVRVTLRRDGTIVDAVVVRHTGFPYLDAEARNVILRIARFAPVPEHIGPTQAEFVIDQPISFKRS